MKFRFCTVVLCLISIVIPALAAPSAALVKSGTAAQNSDSILFGTSIFALDLRLSTDGLSASGVQLVITTSPAGSVSYAGSNPITALSNPFVPADLSNSSGPVAGEVIEADPEGRTVFFKSQGTDYAPFSDNAIATYQIDTSSLAIGMYTFTPVLEEFIFDQGNSSITDFDAPQSFTLTVVPEPSALLLLGVGFVGVMARRRSGGRNQQLS